VKKVYTEMGVGNDTFFSTEIEEGEHEYRIFKFFKPPHIGGYYFRFWILKKVFIFSTNKGFDIQSKDKNKFKILFGISGKFK